MLSEGLYSCLTAVCVLLGSLSAETTTLNLNVREGLTNYLLHCYNHGSASGAQKRISWIHTKNEIRDSQMAASLSDAENVTVLASWSGSDTFVSDPTAWTLDDYQIGGKYSLRIFNASFPRDNGYFYCVDQDSRDIIRRFHLLILGDFHLLWHPASFINTQAPTTFVNRLMSSPSGKVPSDTVVVKHHYNNYTGLTNTLINITIQKAVSHKTPAPALQKILWVGSDNVSVKITEIWIAEASAVKGTQMVNVTAGEITRLSCRVNRANPAPEFLWTKNNHLFSNASYPESEDSGVIIFTPTREMNGETVRCLANNQNGPDEIAAAKLNVLYPPVVTVSWQSGINVLTCEAEGNPAQYEFNSWQHRVRSTLVDTIQGSASGSTSVLHLPPSGYFVTGDYICSVSNGVGHEQSASYFVQPKSAPVFEARSRTILAPSGGRLDMTVSFYSHPVFSSVVWEKAEKEQTVKLNFHKEKPAYPSLDFKDTPAHLAGNVTTLSFSAVEEQDSGIYTVIVTNSEGASSYSITLKVHDAPVGKQDPGNAIPVNEDSNVQSQRQVTGDDGQLAARQGKGEPASSPVSVTLVAVVSCVSVVVIIPVVVGVCLVKHGKISLYVRGDRYSESSGTPNQSASLGSESGLPLDKTHESGLSDQRNVEDRSVISCQTESTAGSVSTISETPKVVLPYSPQMSYPPMIEPNEHGLLPPGSLQSMV